MRACRGVILGSLAHHTVSVSDEEQVQGVFFVRGTMHREVFKDKLVVGDFVHLHLRQIEEALSCMVLVQQVVAAVIVDLKVTHIDRVLERVPFRDLVEDVAYRPRDNAAVCVPLGTTSDGVCLARARLSIREDRSIVAVEARVDNLFMQSIRVGEVHPWLFY